MPRSLEEEEEEEELQMLKVVHRAKETHKGTLAKDQELHKINEQLKQENQDLHLTQFLHQQRIEALELEVQQIKEALTAEKRDHELTHRALELAQRTT